MAGNGALLLMIGEQVWFSFLVTIHWAQWAVT